MPLMPGSDRWRRNLSDHVAQHLIFYIRENKLRSGAKVSSELSVSSKLGIGHGIVREAYGGLRMVGIFDVSNGPNAGS